MSVDASNFVKWAKSNTSANEINRTKQVIKSKASTLQSSSSNKWYSGDQPRLGEIYARINQIGKTDPESAKKAYSYLSQLQGDKSSQFYRPYAQPTNRAADYLAANGFNTELLTNGWLNSSEAAGYIRSNLVYDGATNTPKTPGKKSTADQYNAYWLNQYLAAEKDTNAAQSEIDGSFDFINYWTNASDRNLSDDQIKQKYKDEYYSKNCPTLQKMQKNADENKPLELNKAMDFSDDTIDAMIWMARNPGYTGNIEGAMTYRYLGAGNKWQDNAEISAKLDPQNEQFLPYAVGSTNLDDEAYLFDVRSFTKDWIQQNNGLQYEDTPEGKAYRKVLAAEDDTVSAETALEGLNKWIDQNKSKWTTQEEAQAALDKVLAKGTITIGKGKDKTQYDLSILNKIDATIGKNGSIGTGNLIAFNRPIDYKYDNVVRGFGDIVAANNQTPDGLQTANNLSDDITFTEPEPVKAPETKAPSANDGIDAVSGADTAVRKPGDQTGVRTPTDLAPVNYTDSEIEQIRVKDKKISEASGIVDDVATENESTVMKNAGSVAFFGNKDRFSWIRNNAVSNQRFADGLTNISAKNLMSEGLGKAHSVAEYSNVEANYAEDQQLFNQYRQKYGDLQYLQKEFKPTMTLTLEGADGDTYNVTLTYQDMNNGYQISDVVNTNYVFGESESGNDPGIYEQANAIAREQTAEAKKILYAQKNVHDNYGEAGEKEVKEYKALSARIHNEESYLADNKEANDQNIAALKKSIEKMEMQYDAMTKEGLDTSGIKRSYDLLNNVLNYYDEPQLPRSTMTKLQYTDMVGQLVGEEYDTEKKSELLHRSINNVDEKIRQIQDDIDYAKAQGIEIPDRYLRNMQLTIEDLEADRKGFEYSAILTDTDPEELDKAIEAGKEFEQYVIDNVLIDDNIIHPAYGFEHLQQVATEEDQKIYYYLLGKQALEHGDEYQALLHSNNPDDVLTKSGELMESIMKDSSDYLDFMLDDDYGVWTSRRAEANKEEAKAMVDSGFGGGLIANVASTILTPIESLSSAIYILDRAIEGKRINPDSKFRSVTQFKESTRAETRASIEEAYKDKPTLKYLANLGYEIYCNRGDSMMNSLLTGAVIQGSGMLAEFAGASPMGATAALTAAANAIENGASTEQAWLIAGMTFIAETATEAITYSNIREAFGVKDALTKESLKQFTIDWLTKSGVEEMIGETTNDVVENWADRMATEWFDNPNYQSEHQKLVDYYYSQGYTGEGEAETKALEDEMKGYLHTAFVSYISAGTDVMVKAGKAALNTARTAADVVNGYRSYTKARQKIGFGESMLDYMKQDARNAIANRNQNTQTSQEVSVQEAGVAVPSETAEATPEQKQAAADVTALGRVEGSSQTAQTEMVASVLDDGEGDTAVSDQANAAATFMPTVLGNDSTFVIQQVITGASRMGIDQATVKTALRNAALGNGAATALVQSEQFQNASSEQKAQMLAETIEQDQNNPDVQQNIAAKVNDFRSGMVINDLAAQGHFDQAQQAQDKADAAAVETAKAETQLQEKQDALDEATRDVEQKAQAVAENPTDDNMKQHADAVTRADNADESRKQYEEHLAKQQEAQKEADAKAKQAKDDAMTSARETASQTVTQQDQQRAEEQQYRQLLIDNGIIDREYDTYSGETDLFGTDEEQEARRNANFSYDNYSGDISYFGANTDNVVQMLENAGFHKKTAYNAETGDEKFDYYVINRNDISAEQLKTINDSINESKSQAQAEQDEMTGKADEDRRAALVEQLLDNENLQGEERDARHEKLMNQLDKVKVKITDLKQSVSNTEGRLALYAFERKLGIPIQFADLGPVDSQRITRGKYENGTIYLNENLIKSGKMTVGQALVEASLHEIIHSVRNTNAYNSYRNVVMNALYGARNSDNAVSLYNENSDYRAAIDTMIADRAAAGDPNFTSDDLNRMIEIADEEIVADFARMNLAEKDVVQRLMDAGMGGKMRNTLHNINQALKNYFGNLTGEERKTAETLRRAERNLQKAINEAAETSVHPEGGQFSISQFAQSAGLNFDQNTLVLTDQNGNVIDGVNNKVTADMMNNTPVGMLIDLARDGAKAKNGNVKFESTISAETAQAQKQMFADLMNMVAQYKDSDLVWEIASSTMFSALKSNSDPQYSTTVDFGTVCAKTQEIINVMSQVMLEKGRGLTREEVLKVYNETANANLTVPCPVCYVFSRWMGVPSLLNQMSQYQKRFVALNDDGSINMEKTGENANTYIKSALEKYGSKDKIDDAKVSLVNRMKTQEKNRTAALAVLNSETATAEEKAKAQTKHDEAIKNLDNLQKELGEVEAYNWVTQALCLQQQKGKTKYNVLDKNGNYVIDPSFELTPDNVLFDLRQTGEFAKYTKNWQYRNTRGAGMGKAIMPYSGESIGDIIYGTSRKSEIMNPFLTQTYAKAADGIKNAINRAKQQNLIGGQRLQSTSDFRPEWGLDYMMAFLELQAVGSKVQMYTKVAEAVDLLASMGGDINLSIMGKGQGWHVDENGNQVLDFSDVTGMDYETAKALKDQYDNVQMILVGMNDTHIKLALANPDIDFVIPWHSSGNSKDTLASLVSSASQGEEQLETSSDYTDTQSDKESENQTEDQKKLWNLRMKILQGQKLTEADRQIILADEDYLKPLYERFTVKGKDDDCYKVKLAKDQAKQIFPYEYWNKSLTKDQANANGQAFIDYCQHFGIVPRFSGVVKTNDDGTFSVTGNFAGAIYDENGNITGYDPNKMYDGYWKVLIDRPMYDNKDNYRDQQVVDVTKAKIGTLENGKLTNSDMPLKTSAMYGPNYSTQEKTAVDNSLAAIEQMEQARMNGGKQSVMGDLTAADQDLMTDAVNDYADAVARGDTEAAQEDVDFYAEQKGYTDECYHGTEFFGFTEFDLNRGDGTVFVAYTPGISKTYAYDADVKEIGKKTDIGNMTHAEIADQFNRQNNATYRDEKVVGCKALSQEEMKARLNDIIANGGENRDLDMYQAFAYNESYSGGVFELELGNGETAIVTPFAATTLLEKSMGQGLYRLYSKPGKQLVIDTDRAVWNNIPWSLVAEADPEAQGVYPDTEGQNTRTIAEWAKEHGYDSVRINNIYDYGGRGTESKAYGDIGIFFRQDDVKSADPVTYDDNGNVIPLDQRFSDSPDIRYSTEGELTDADRDLMEEQELNQYMADRGIITPEELAAYQERTGSRPLEGQNPTMSTAQGPAQRAFGDADGMLRNSDEIAGFAKAVVEAQNSYFPDTNNEQVHRAISWIRSLKQTPNSDGYAEALNAVTKEDFDYRSADGQARMVAVMGMAVARNDTMAQVALADAFNRQGTDLGRALQARKLFKLMTPAGRISTLQKMIDNYNVDLKKNGDKEIKFSHWVYEAAAAAETADDFHQVLEVAAAELAAQLPISWKERLNSLRMVSMLANPRTHIRNLVGNALFVPAVGMKNKIGAVLEKAFVEKGERTKTLAPILNKEIREFARQDARAIRDVLTGEAKYDENTLVQKAKNPLGPVLGVLSDVNSKFLEGEDWLFLRGHYRRALGSWMQANGYTVDQVKNDKALLEKGRQYAINEAQKATYRDFNGVAQKLNQIVRNANTPGQKAFAFGVNAVLPFKKTPANILKRGIEYSPLGIARSVYNLGKKFMGGDVTANQVIDQFTAGLSGTAAMALGYLLAGTGAVSCGFDDDDWPEELEGKQKYSINPGKAGNKVLEFFGAPKLFGEDITYTLDWAAPMAMPFFVGASIRNQADQEGWDVNKVLDAMSSITEPVFNLSMLDGVNSLLKVNAYSKDKPYAQIGAKIASNYVSSYVPSVLGAIARSIDDTQRKSYVKKEDKQILNGTFNYALETAENKIPGLSQNNIPVRDVWGRAKVSDLAERIIENWISPGYIEHVQDDPVVNELGRLFDSTQSKYLEPEHADQTIDGKGLDAEVYDTFDRVHGETQYSMLKELFSNEEYQNMTDDDAKVEIVRKVYSYANKVSRAAVDEEYRYEKQSVSEMIKDGKTTDYKSKMIQCLDDGNLEGFETYVEALREEGVEDSTIKTKIGDKYRDQWKKAYRNYLETENEKYSKQMEQIEDILDTVSDLTDFEFNIYGKNGWESKVDEEYD